MINYIQTSHRFKRDVEALRKKHLPIQNIKVAVHHIIMEDNKLLYKSYDDHALSGSLKGYRDLHVKGYKDLVIIYSIIKSKSLLKLARVNNHDKVFK